MRLEVEHFPPVMALTQDGLPLSHAEQARALAAAGAGWVQLRIKNAAPEAWLATAREVVAACHAAGALCTINDSVDVALESGADGVHLGSLDEGWAEARARLGPDLILGGTVNHAADARRAAAAGVLDYVGVGPLRFTATKQRLAPVLGPDGIAALLPLLEGLPAWAIGGVLPADLPGLRRAGLAGVAVSSSLYDQQRVAANHAAFVAAWNADSPS
jgi:thiamine-phosphate pyrophosphorylase